MTRYRPLYQIDATEPVDGVVDVRVRVAGGDDYDAVRTFAADVALYGADGGVALADWIGDVVRDFYVQSASGQQTGPETRWIEQTD